MTQRNLTPTLIALSAALVLGACASPPAVNPALENARATVERAQSTPSAARSGGQELERARQTLRQADAAWNKDHDATETAHLAYLAQQRAEIALAMGAQADAEARMQQSAAERDRTRLQARTREAEAATAAARTAQSDAALSRAQSELLAQQAMASQQQAQSAQNQASAEAERAAALQRDLQALAARSTERGMVVTLGDVLFETGKATLQPGALRSADQLANVLKQYPERRVMIEGFTDSVGADEMNLELSRRRAAAFQSALIERGVGSDRIEVKGQGEAFPVADNNSASGRQQNRRVEVLFSDPQGHFMARTTP